MTSIQIRKAKLQSKKLIIYKHTIKTHKHTIKPHKVKPGRLWCNDTVFLIRRANGNYKRYWARSCRSKWYLMSSGHSLDYPITHMDSRTLKAITAYVVHNLVS